MSAGLAQTQRAFTAALLDPELTMPAFLCDRPSQRTASAFAVYRNNVVAGLINALVARFPVIVRMVGEEAFRALARRFIALHPPRSPVLLAYGGGFPEFLHGLTSTPSAEYLADIARLEIARGRAYHAADADPLHPDRFAALAPERLASLKVALHPSVALLRSKFPVVSAWEANQPGIEQPIRCWSAEDAVVTRLYHEVTVARLGEGGFAFLSALANDATLAMAIDAAVSDAEGFDLAANLALLAGSRLVVGFR
jgi:hypothetical protein